MKTGIAALVALIFAAGQLGAQQHQRKAPADSGNAPRSSACHQGEMMSGTNAARGTMMAMPAHDVMQQAMRLMPNRILQSREVLELTPEQITQLEKLNSDLSAAHPENMAATRQAKENLKQLFDADSPDPEAVRAAAEKFVSLRAASHADRIAVAAAVRGTLTAAQLEQVRALSPCPMDKGMMQGGESKSPMSPAGQQQHHPSEKDGGS